MGERRTCNVFLDDRQTITAPFAASMRERVQAVGRIEYVKRRAIPVRSAPRRSYAARDKRSGEPQCRIALSMRLTNAPRNRAFLAWCDILAASFTRAGISRHCLAWVKGTTPVSVSNRNPSAGSLDCPISFCREGQELLRGLCQLLRHGTPLDGSGQSGLSLIPCREGKTS